MACERRCGCAAASAEELRNEWENMSGFGKSGGCGCEAANQTERVSEGNGSGCRGGRGESRSCSCGCGQGVVCAFAEFTRRVANGARTMLFGCSCGCGRSRSGSCGCGRRSCGGR